MFDRKKFDRDFERTQKVIGFTYWLSVIVTLAMLAGMGYVAYKVLIFIGIL